MVGHVVFHEVILYSVGRQGLVYLYSQYMYFLEQPALEISFN